MCPHWTARSSVKSSTVQEAEWERLNPRKGVTWERRRLMGETRGWPVPENLRSRSLGSMAARWVAGQPDLEEVLEDPGSIHTTYLLRRLQIAARMIMDAGTQYPDWLREEATSFIRIHGYTSLTLDDIREQKAYRIFVQFKGDEYRELKELAAKRGLTIPELTRQRMLELLSSAARPKPWERR